MALSRRSILMSAAGAAATGLAATVPAIRTARAQGGKKLKLGIITDLSGPYADLSRPSGVCAKQAFEDFGVAAKGWDVELLVEDHLNKPDNAVAIARRFIDQEGVDALLDVNTSATSLACVGFMRERNKVMLLSGPGTSELTGKQCSPNHIHWAWDTWMLSHVAGNAVLKQGGDKWYFIAADYAFGQALARDGAATVVKGGGKVLGTALYPFPTTTDFSALLVQAQASGANVLALCNGGADTINSVKQAHEFGLNKTMTIVSLLSYDTDVRAIGPESAQGMMTAQPYYWDLNDRTRAFNARVMPKTTNKLPPNFGNAGVYSSAMHYLKVVADMGIDQARADGAAVIARMKATPTDDDAFGPGRIREDGRKLHPVYLMQAKSPAESKGPADALKLVATVPADQAFRPLNDGGCPLVKV